MENGPVDVTRIRPTSQVMLRSSQVFFPVLAFKQLALWDVPESLYRG